MWLKDWDNISLNQIETFDVECKYLWYDWTERIKHKRFISEKEALLERARLIKKIQKDWWLDLAFEWWELKKMFVFQSQFKNINLKVIWITEKFMNVKHLLT